jgi:LPXTG-motif cell wall-anchored protein
VNLVDIFSSCKQFKMTNINLKNHSKQIISLCAIFLISYNSLSQESLTVEMKKDNQDQGNVVLHFSNNDSTKIDSQDNLNIKTSSFIKNGESLQLIQIDNTSSTNNSSLFIIIVLLTILIGVLVYYFFRRRKGTVINNLTNQEMNIVTLIDSGKTNLQISEELSISKSTVKTHVNNIYRKLNISSRRELKNMFSSK